MIDHDYGVRFVRYERGCFEFNLILRWQRPLRMPYALVMVIPPYDRLFYPSYNTYRVCGQHGPLRSYTRFWRSSATRREIAQRVEECVGPFVEVAIRYDVAGDLELGFHRKGAFIYSRGTMEIPPSKDSERIKELTEVLIAVAGCYAKSWISRKG